MSRDVPYLPDSKAPEKLGRKREALLREKGGQAERKQRDEHEEDDKQHARNDKQHAEQVFLSTHRRVPPRK